MEEIKATKKERKFLRAMGDIALTLARELVLGIGKKLINKVGNKRQGLIIAAILFASVTACAQYPGTGNKMRLGYQTSGDGLVYRGRSADTVSIKSTGLNNAYHIHDTVNNVLLSFIKTKGGWVFNNSDTVIVNNNTDTTSLSNRINLKVNFSDTSAMLTNYLRTGVATSTFQPILTSGINIKTINSNNLLGSGNISVGNVTGNGSNLYFGIFTSSTNITQSLLRWDGNPIPNSTLISDFNFNQFNGNLSVTGSNTLSNLAGTGTRMVVASSTGLLSTQSTGVSLFSAGTTGLTPSTATSGAVTLSGTLAVSNGGTGATTQSNARTNLGATVRGANVFTLADISALSFLRYNADNTVSQRGADGMRSDLGGTTIGQSMFTLTNPSVITFPRFNADNTVTARIAADFRSDIGAGTGNGNGTVTNVSAGSPANGLSVATGTTTPVISMALAASGTIGVVSATTQVFGGNKTFNGTVTLASATGTATSVIGTSSSGQIVGVTLNTGIGISGGTLSLDFKSVVTVGTDFPSTSAQKSSDITFTVTGVVVGQPVLLGVPDGSAPNDTNYTAWVSSTNTVKIRFNNYSAGAVDPNPGAFTIRVFNL